MNAEQDEGAVGETVSFRQSACDNCQRREVKCDRNNPCSSCVTSRVPCVSSNRSTEKRPRVVLSSQYDQTIEEVREEIRAVSEKLQLVLDRELLSDASNRGVGLTPPHHSSPRTVVGPYPKPIEYEGDSSFTAHARHIAEALESTLLHPNGRSLGPVDQPKFGILPASTISTGSDISLDYPELSGLNLPPTDVALKLLNFAKATKQNFFSRHQIIDETEFIQICTKIYFPTNPYDIFSWIMLNIGLHGLLLGCKKADSGSTGISESEADSYVKLCICNIDAATSSLRIVSEASLSACQTLAACASHYMRNGYNDRTWRLTTIAARMSLDLGLHRVPLGSRSEEFTKKRLIFYYVYLLDISFAFSIGMTPNIHDYDVTTERPVFPDDLSGFRGRYMALFLNFAAAEKQMYLQLFSALALQEPKHVRAERAQRIAYDLIESHDRLASLHLEAFPDQLYVQESLLSLDVVKYGLLTILLRLVPPPGSDSNPSQFCDECVASARSSLLAIVKGGDDLKHGSKEDARSFLNWTLSFMPPVSFVVMVSQTITTRNIDDLSLLHRMVTTIESATEESPSMQKLHTACQGLYNMTQQVLAHNASQEGRKHQNAQQPAQDVNAHAWNESSGADWQNLTLTEADWSSVLNEFDFGMAVENSNELATHFSIATGQPQLDDLPS